MLTIDVVVNRRGLHGFDEVANGNASGAGIENRQSRRHSNGYKKTKVHEEHQGIVPRHESVGIQVNE